MANLERLNSLTEGKVSGWREKAKWRAENKEWLKQSAKMAVRVLLEIKSQGITQKIVAERMEVSPQQVNKIVKGTENLTLETIVKLEKALCVSLISVLSMDNSMSYFPTQPVRITKRVLSSSVKSSMMVLQEPVKSNSETLTTVA